MKKGALIWITGLSGVGKSTIAEYLQELLEKKYDNIIWIDGDVLRKIFDITGGYDLNSRKKYAYVYSRLCEFLVKSGMIVICSTISLFEEVRKRNRDKNDIYLEVFLEAPFEVLESRNSKNIYSEYSTKKNIVGIDIVPEFPRNADLHFDTTKFTIKEVSESIEDKFYDLYETFSNSGGQNEKDKY